MRQSPLLILLCLSVQPPERPALPYSKLRPVFTTAAVALFALTGGGRTPLLSLCHMSGAYFYTHPRYAFYNQHQKSSSGQAVCRIKYLRQKSHSQRAL